MVKNEPFPVGNRRGERRLMACAEDAIAIYVDHDDQNPRPLGKSQTGNLRPQLQHAAAAGEAVGGASAQGRAVVSSESRLVMPGLVPGSHVSKVYPQQKTWMAGTSPAMTETRSLSLRC